MANVGGAIFSTISNGSVVNANQYDSPWSVYLNGGPGANAPASAADLPAGAEKGDKCAWISSARGAAANVTFPDGASFPVQSLWSSAFNSCAGACVLSFP
jgi:hypothetical protein